MPLVTVAGQTYSVHEQLIEKWNKLKDGKLAQQDDDKVFVVDGRERSGKSVFAMQQIGAIDPTIFEETLATGKLSKRVCFTAEDTLKAIRNTKSSKTQTKAVWFDEAFRGLASTSVLSKTNKLIVQAMMEMGQNNLVLFIVLPSFFLLDRYPAVLRSNALFHIQKEKNNPKLRNFYVYNYQKKAALYHMGIKKGWGYPVYTKFRGRFYNKYPGGPEFEKIYREGKHKAFQEMESKMLEYRPDSKFKLQRDWIIKYLREEKKMSLKAVSELIPEKTGEILTKISPSAISMSLKRLRDILGHAHVRQNELNSRITG
jgi:hypothetical protein